VLTSRIEYVRLNVSKMSDKLNLIDFEKFKDAVSVSDDHCLNCVRQQSVSSVDIILTINITYDCLRRWHEAKRAGLLKQIKVPMK